MKQIAYNRSAGFEYFIEEKFEAGIALEGAEVKALRQGKCNLKGFKLFDQNLSLTAGEPSKMSEMMALNIYNTFFGRTGWEGVGQAKAVLFFILVVGIGLIQLRITRSKEVQQ